MEEGKPKRTSEAPSISSAMTSCLALGSEMSSASQGTEWVSLVRAPALWWEPGLSRESSGSVVGAGLPWLAVHHPPPKDLLLVQALLPALPASPALPQVLPGVP